MKKNKKIKTFLLTMMMCIISISIPNVVKAVSVSISASTSIASANQSFTVTISSDATGRVNISATNASVSANEVWLEEGKQYITVTPNGSGNVTVTATPVNPMSLNGEKVYPTAASCTIKLKTEGNSDSGTTTNNNQANSNTQQPETLTKSSNANVKMITTSPVDFSGFKPSKTSGYAVTVENDTDKINVNVTKEDSKASVSLLNKTNSDKGKSWVYLAEGNNEINVTVTSEDGKTQKTYTINVTRKAKEETEEPEQPEEPEENSEEEPMEEAFGLTELNIEGLKLNPQFQTDVYEYKVELKENLEKLNITTLATKESAKIEITGNDNLQEGENIITIIVKGENEAETVAYQIIVNKTVENQEDITVQTDKDKIKKIIILSVAVGVIFIIVISVIIAKVKKSKLNNDEYIQYENINLDYDEENKNDNDFFNNDEDDDYYDEEPRKKKRSKGKRFK